MVHGINGKREGLKCVRKYQEQQQALQTLQKHGKKPHYRHKSRKDRNFSSTERQKEKKKKTFQENTLVWVTQKNKTWENPNGGKRKNSRPQLAAEGVESLQAAGSVTALVTLMAKPNWALLLKASQRHLGAVLSTVFKEEQHVPCGLVTVLPLLTKVRQSDKVNTRFEHSTDGAGAGARAWCDDEPRSTAQIATTHTMRYHFAVIFRTGIWRRCSGSNGGGGWGGPLCWRYMSYSSLMSVRTNIAYY